ncbi:hypothetical protein Slin15195_G107130 [Septoria linicola]|uniref:Uncharacterized protein n=1 Tax=Septoria linicola TaxID=215465 RepID=A0A9Q9AXU9_9PEZI|nr:hypothetical protein Slin15195_G107130 [Septoria linicola]
MQLSADELDHRTKCEAIIAKAADMGLKLDKEGLPRAEILTKIERWANEELSKQDLKRVVGKIMWERNMFVIPLVYSPDEFLIQMISAVLPKRLQDPDADVVALFNEEYPRMEASGNM